MEVSLRQDMRKTGIYFLMNHAKAGEKDSRFSDYSQSKGSRSPESYARSNKKQYQPHQRKRNESMNQSGYVELEGEKALFNNSMPMFQDFPLKVAEKSMQLRLLANTRLKPVVKQENKRKFSPYKNIDSFVLQSDRTNKPLPKVRARINTDLGDLQQYVIEFQEKSKRLLKQLEKNVFGK